MDRIQAQDIALATDGTLFCGNPRHEFFGVSIDSRTIASKDLFVAIQGEVHDGHRFIESVIRNGISGIVVQQNKAADYFSEEWKNSGVTCIAVSDTTKALGDIARFHRNRMNASVIAITGSNGKTTTRSMTSSVVAQKYATLSTQGNKNNEIGVPLTLFQLRPEHQWAVLELGMNHFGEIARLCGICLPDVGVITNVAPAHLEGVGSIEGVMRAKGELLEHMNPSGTAILNADDHRVLQLAQETSVKTILFGTGKQAMITATGIEEKDDGIAFDLNLPDQSMRLRLDVPATFMIHNALAAASVGHVLGMTGQEISKGLESFIPVQGRMNVIRTENDVHIIDDTYNANPGSMAAAIETLTRRRNTHRSIIVIGDMRELGNHADSLHKKIGSIIAKASPTRLYITGDHSGHVAEGALDAGMASKNIFKGTKQEIVSDLTGILMPGDWVLVKGSRAMGMETVVEALKKG